MPDDIPTAVLTKKQREWLRGEDEPTQKRTMKTRIRQRLRQSFFDLQLLADEFPEGDIRDAVEPSEEEERPPLWAPIALLYLTTPPDATTLGPAVRLQSDEGRDTRAVVLEPRVDHGVEHAIGKREGAAAAVSTSIEVTRSEDLDELAQQDLTEIHPRLLRQLLQAGEISEAEYGRAIKQRIERAESGDPAEVAKAETEPVGSDDEE